MLTELIRAFILIFIAEMGDKTQILAMAFASKFLVHQVLLGVFFGSLFNHGIAVLLGASLSYLIPLNTLRLIAAILFILFGFWTLKPDTDENKNTNFKKFGPVVTVALAFFIGELGDKTQLATITLATNTRFPLFILIGSILGMLASSSVAIFIGSRFGRKIPELGLKMASASVFMIFGIIGLAETIPYEYLTLTNNIIFFGILGSTNYLLVRSTIKYHQQSSTPLKESAAQLYEKVHAINEIVNTICLGEEYCKNCQGESCLIGFSKLVLADFLENNNHNFTNTFSPPIKSFNKKKAAEALAKLINIAHDSEPLHKTRKALEVICFGQPLPYNGDIKQYLQHVKEKDPQLAAIICKYSKQVYQL